MKKTPPTDATTNIDSTSNETDIAGRFCGNVTADLSCCLPCPIEHWVYSDAFMSNARIAFWFNVPALVAQVFLLVTFAVLLGEKGHGHYLSVGLVVSMVMLEVSCRS